MSKESKPYRRPGSRASGIDRNENRSSLFDEEKPQRMKSSKTGNFGEEISEEDERALDAAAKRTGMYGVQNAKDVAPETSSVSLLATLPEELRDKASDLMVSAAGFGAGPGFMGQHSKVFKLPVSLRDGALYLERYRGTYKRAHLKLTDGRMIFLTPDGFETIQENRSKGAGNE